MMFRAYVPESGVAVLFTLHDSLAGDSEPRSRIDFKPHDSLERHFTQAFRRKTPDYTAKPAMLKLQGYKLLS